MMVRITVSIDLSEDAMNNLPQSVRSAFLELFEGHLLRTDDGPADTETRAEGEEWPADLSVAQAKRFLEGCSEKSRRIIRAIVEQPDRKFEYSAFLDTLQMEESDLGGGVWAGLTKRTRTILRDGTSKLIVWSRYDDDENGTDWKGAISEITYRSFRVVLKIV